VRGQFSILQMVSRKGQFSILQIWSLVRGQFSISQLQCIWNLSW